MSLFESYRLFRALFRQLVRSPRGRADFGTLVRYHALVNKGATRGLLQAYAETVDPEVKEVVMTVAEQLERKGQARGEAIGQAKAILVVLAARRIAVPATVRKRILGCDDLPVLEKWISRAVSVSKAADLFEG